MAFLVRSSWQHTSRHLHKDPHTPHVTRICTHSLLPGRTLTPPRRKLALPRRKLALPRRNLALPRRKLALSRRKLALSRRKLALPRRKLALPRRKLAPPRRKLALPRRKLAPPRRKLAPSPRNGLARPVTVCQAGVCHGSGREWGLTGPPPRQGEVPTFSRPQAGRCRGRAIECWMAATGRPSESTATRRSLCTVKTRRHSMPTVSAASMGRW
jgi:hypothetical protein